MGMRAREKARKGRREKEIEREMQAREGTESRKEGRRESKRGREDLDGTHGYLSWIQFRAMDGAPGPPQGSP